MVPVFPPELFKEILDHFTASFQSEDESHDYHKLDCAIKAEMKSLSLVSKAFLHLCRPIIFQEINISPCHGQRLTNLSQLLKSDLYLAQHVRHIDANFEDGCGPLSNENGILSPLLQLPTVSSLWISNFRDRKKWKRWSERSGLQRVLTSDLSQYGCHSVLGRYLTLGSLTTLTIQCMSDVPLIPILSSSTLRTLVLDKCTIFEDPESPSQNAIKEGFNLTKFDAIDTSDIPLDFIAACTNIERIYLDDTCRCDPPYPRRRLIFDKSNIPFTKLIDAVFAGENCPEWATFFTSTKEENGPALPSLRKMQLSLDSHYQDALEFGHAEICIRILRHSPALEDLALSGDSITTMFLEECFEESPCRLSLKSLSVTWTFSYEPLDDEDPTFENAVNGLFLVNLPILEVFGLHIFLGRGSYSSDTVESHFLQLRKLHQIFVQDSYNYPQLQELEIVLHLEVVKDRRLSLEEYEKRCETLSQLYDGVLTLIGGGAEFEYTFDIEFM
ncbi:hypothetical protein BJ165DRAFT_1526460 [Panaeolus papilionaceus]|nr:hypothetical protein BJ165DRAFT_1526460 [Panaeolus papilionaceus]